MCVSVTVYVSVYAVCMLFAYILHAAEPLARKAGDQQRQFFVGPLSVWENLGS